MVDGQSSQTKIFSQNTIYMICLYHFSVKCIIKKNYLPQGDNSVPVVSIKKVFIIHFREKCYKQNV